MLQCALGICSRIITMTHVHSVTARVARQGVTALAWPCICSFLPHYTSDIITLQVLVLHGHPETTTQSGVSSCA